MKTIRTHLRSLTRSFVTHWRTVDVHTRIHYLAACVVLILCIVGTLLYRADRRLMSNYASLLSVTTRDRSGVVLTLAPNAKGSYTEALDTLPSRVSELLVKKEDRFFYLHPGVNPLSTARAVVRSLTGHRVGGASTITQQLVKNLLGQTQDRSLSNKVLEMLYALDLELFTPKERILTMYANTVYMGNRVSGLRTASELYFNEELEKLDDTKLSMLLATLSAPNTQNPWRDENATASRNLARQEGVTFDPTEAVVTKEHSYIPPKNFELTSMRANCTTDCTTTIDADLTNRLRAMLNRRVEQGWDVGARSGAVVVVKLPENEVLAVVGTPDPNSFDSGQQINMALEPRPIGSTAKPFIYLQGFTKGLRPYTLVDDREYKFPIGSGFPLYPKNYDGTYRGWITLHSALSNSLNIPTVETLQYVGLHNFYDFLLHSLSFTPVQDLDTYQYGIALGALEMDPLTLAQLLSLFPANGTLKPLQLYLSGTTTRTITTPMSKVTTTKKVADAAYTQLVTKILNDRLTGVQQFGLASSLNLSQSNYAVKTGTSQDYHDSWTIGYTPDFLVVVWYGNPDNTPLQHVTGQSGAGGVWHDAMEILLNSPYNHKTPLDTSSVREIPIEGSLDFGLAGESVADHRNLLPDNTLITSPQDCDTYLKESNTRIPLVSPEDVSWYVDGALLGTGTRVFFSPTQANDYTIKAMGPSGKSTHVIIHIISRP